jgi:hypothetical protein
MGTRRSFPEGKAAGFVKLTTDLLLVLRAKMVKLYLHFPMHLNGVVLN